MSIIGNTKYILPQINIYTRRHLHYDTVERKKLVINNPIYDPSRTKPRLDNDIKYQSSDRMQVDRFRIQSQPLEQIVPVHEVPLRFSEEVYEDRYDTYRSLDSPHDIKDSSRALEIVHISASC